MFVYTMKKTLVNYRMVPSLSPCPFPFAPFQILEKIFMRMFLFSPSQGSSSMITSQTTFMIKRRGRYSYKTHGMILKSSSRGRRMGGKSSIGTGLKLRGPSTSLKAQYLPSALIVFQMRLICLFTVYDDTQFPKVLDVAFETLSCCAIGQLGSICLYEVVP